jgi:hypothetical protein
MCLSHLIQAVRPCMIHTCNDMPVPCSDHSVLLKAIAQHSCRETAVLCCGLEKNGMVGAWHGYGVAGVNQTRPHCVNQMGKTHSKPLAARHGRGAAWKRHAMCESAFKEKLKEEGRSETATLLYRNAQPQSCGARLTRC